MAVGDVRPSRESEPPAGHSEDEVFRVLAHRRRRYALHYLLHNEAPVEIGQIADHVAAWENEIPPVAVTADQRKRVYTALQQNHLPQMDDLGFVEFDKHRGTVEVTESTEDLDIYLEVVRGRDIPWTDYYLGLAALSLSLVLANWVDVFPIAEIPDIGWAVFVPVAFAVSALVHKYHNNKLGTEPIPPDVDVNEVTDERSSGGQLT